MKTITSQLQTHLEGEVTSLATIWRVTRADGTEFFFTDHDEDITFEANTYESSVGYDRTNVDNTVGLSVDNLNVTGFLDSSAITEGDLRAGLFDFAEIRVGLVNWQDLSQGQLRMRRGRLGEVVYSEVTGTFDAELRGLTQLYSQGAVELFQAECRADLGDSRCKVDILPAVVPRNTAFTVGQAVRASASGTPITEDFDDVVYRVTTAGTTAGSQPAYDPTVGNTTTDGTAVFTAEEAFTRALVVATVTDNRNFTVTFPNGADPREVDDWFRYGAVTWDTGLNAGLAMEVKGYVASSNTVELFLDMPFTVAVGDKAGIYAGCDKRLPTCRDKFDAVVNFRGEPYVPGQDELLTYPDAR